MFRLLTYQSQQVTKYDLWDVAVTRVNPSEVKTSEPASEIQVPGLEEKRPSLLKGDRVYLWVLGREWCYEGIVWEFRKSSIIALFAGMTFGHP